MYHHRHINIFCVIGKEGKACSKEKGEKIQSFGPALPKQIYRHGSNLLIRPAERF
jgi:hypothetical protein